MRRVKSLELLSGRCYSICLVLAVLVVVMSVAATSLPVLAATVGDASFSLSPTTGTYTVGSTLTLSVYETSSSSDNTNAVDANLTYPANLLKYNTQTLGAFTLCTSQYGGNGSVGMACAAPTTQSGTELAVAISFTVQAAGAAQISMVSSSGTDIDSTSGASVWNGSLPSANYTFNTPVVNGGGGSTSPVSTNTSRPTTVRSSDSTSSAPASIKSTTTQTTTNSTTPSPVVVSLGSISITVTDSSGHHIANATVILDRTRLARTNSDGVANFSAVRNGNHSLSIRAQGMKPYNANITLTPGQNILVKYSLAKSTVMPSAQNGGTVLLVIVIIAIAALMLAGGIYGYFRKFHQKRTKSFVSPPPTPAVETARPLASTDSEMPYNHGSLITPLSPPQTSIVTPPSFISGQGQSQAPEIIKDTLIS